ncbi:unnamed protein product [Alopecurus aequalis]
MARTKVCCRKSTWSAAPIRPRRRCRVMVVSLLVQNPTTIGRKETIAEPAEGVTTRARSRRISAAATALPEEILGLEIFVRLPAKDVLRCRAVCRSWRGITSAPDFLLAHHRRQPSLPLITLYGASNTKGDLPIFKHGRPLLGLHDYEEFKLQASCDGLLLLSFSDGKFRICNPTTRRSAPVPCLTAAGLIGIAALYLHRSSGEYRVLYRKEAAYYILQVRSGRSPRCIGVPSDIVPAWHGRATSKLAPPVVFRDCLHWYLNSYSGILVFDTVVESFRLMRHAAAATNLCTRLCDMEGSIGFSCNGIRGRTIAKIWVLEDYEREVWSFKYHVQLPADVKIFRYIDYDTQHLVLSHKGDVLVYTPHNGYMFHIDRTGKLLEEFERDS